jgi:hypothetical protein
MLDQLDRDLGISSIDNRIHYIYWIGECIERIGALPQMLEDRVTFNDPTNLIIPLPMGFHHETSVYAGQDDVFNIRLSDVGGKYIDNRIDMNTFHIKNGCMYLSKYYPQIMLTYMGLPSDNEGYPLFIDTVHVRTAIIAYIVYRLKYKAAMMGQVEPQLVQMLQQEAYTRISEARGELMRVKTLSESKTQSNIFNKMLHKLDEGYETAKRNPNIR